MRSAADSPWRLPARHPRTPGSISNRPFYEGIKIDTEEEEAEIEGVVVAVEGDEVTIEAEQGRRLTLIVTDKTRIQQEKDIPGRLADIQVGTDVEAKFDPFTRTAVKIDGESGDVDDGESGDVDDGESGDVDDGESEDVDDGESEDVDDGESEDIDDGESEDIDDGESEDIDDGGSEDVDDGESEDVEDEESEDVVPGES